MELFHIESSGVISSIHSHGLVLKGEVLHVAVSYQYRDSHMSKECTSEVRFKEHPLNSKGNI